jgi:hypothetical protein
LQKGFTASAIADEPRFRANGAGGRATVTPSRSTVIATALPPPTQSAARPRAAVLFTILAGAKRHRIEPWTYLRELLLRLHDEDPRLDQMLPDHWAAQHPEAVLTYRLEESRRKAARQSSRRRHARTHHLPR